MISACIIITVSIIIPFLLYRAQTKPMSKKNPPPPSSTLLQLSQRLSGIWEGSNVATEYRLMVMQYIERLAHGEQEKYLKFQVQLNGNQKSHYFDIFRINMRRKIALFKLRTLMKMVKSSLMMKISEICQLMACIRDMNVQISEKVRDMLKFYNLIIEEADGSVLLYVWNLINNINQQNEFIIKSQHNNHMTFSNNYDPFFIYYYERQKEFSMDLPQPRYLDRLYNLNINQIYKIISLKTEMLSLKGKIQKRLKQLGCHYRKQSMGTYMYLVKQQEKTSPFTNKSGLKQQSLYKFQKSLFPVKSSRTKSDDFHFKEQLNLYSPRRVSLNQIDIKSQSKGRLGKIQKNGSVAIPSSRDSGSLNLSRNIPQNRLYNDSRSQSRSERQHNRKLQIVQLEPLSIRLDKPQKYNEEQTQKELRRPVRLQGRIEVMRKQENMGAARSKKYDYNPQNRSKRHPGFIKNLQQKILSKDPSAGLAEQRPIKSRNIVVQPQLINKSMQFPEQTSETIDKFDISIIQPKIQHQQPTHKEQQQKKTRQKQRNKIVTQKIQAQAQQEEEWHQRPSPKVDYQCQTDPYFQDIQSTSSQERQVSLATSEKQECNNPQQHLQAVKFIQRLNRNDDDTSLATLDEQYFIDERLTPMKVFKIPMVREISQEDMKAIDRQRESIAKLSKKQKKIVIYQAQPQKQKEINLQSIQP